MELYKYRGLNNIEYALDLFIEQRLYAANFKNLNDPMEGRFVYKKSELTKAQLRMIRGEKAKYNIVSLSRTPDNMLMWSYYAEGHTGFVIRVEIPKHKKWFTKPVVYKETLRLKTKKTEHDAALSVLTKKLKLWEHGGGRARLRQERKLRADQSEGGDFWHEHGRREEDAHHESS